MLMMNGEEGTMMMTLLRAGVQAFIEYLSGHVLTCLVPAFFIAGAIGVFVSQASVLKYFGAQARKILSYSVASVSGSVLAVCSCTVLPLFSGIYRRGAGIGPATAFLYSGPAINILAIVYTARLLGYDLGAARAIGAVGFAFLIGLTMSFLFRREEGQRGDADILAGIPGGGKTGWKLLTFFSILVAILIFASQHYWILTGISLVALGTILSMWFDRGDVKEWIIATWGFVKLITPWLFAGIVVAGMIRVLLPEHIVKEWVGGNGLRANLIASVLGALMYFATLTEVPILKTFLNLGMGKGPALALLLAGPALSLPNMLVIRNVMGTKKTLSYVGLVIVMATVSGMLFGNYFP
jgi:uncharacterized membrane protein YraQ (UPF0718 family)